MTFNNLLIGSNQIQLLNNFFNQSNFDRYTAYLKGTSLSSASLRRKLSSLSSFQKFLVKKGIVEKPSIKPLLKINPPSFINNLKSKSLVTYLILASLLIISTGIGYTLYHQAITKAKTNFAYTTAGNPVYANRFLSFQGRLTDTSGNPINTSTDILFELYNTPTLGEGTTLYTSASGNSQVVIPDDNGIFSVTIGQSHGTTIPNTVFTENSAVYLQITAGNEVMDPRQPIATVAYAINSESLQGIPPSASGLKDTVLVIDSNGNLNLGESNPAIYASSTAPDSIFRIEGQSLLLKASNNYGGNIEINPDANGIIKLTTEGAGSTAVGGLIDATNANLSTGNLFNGTIGNNNRDYNFISFNNFDAGIGNTQLSTRFSVDAYGNTFIGGTLSPANISIGNTIITSSAAELNYLDGTLATAGSVIYGNGSNLTNSSVGNSGQILMSNASGAPTWINPNTVGIGTTYTAGVGLTLSSSNVFSLNLASANTWTGLQTFNATGAPFAVGSSNLVTNLNANYLNGIASSGFLQIGSTGSLPYVNNTTNTTLTRSGTGPYTLGLNLASANTWTASQTFSRLYQYANGIPSNNLGSPSVTEMAIFDEQFNNKTAFFDINNIFIETSTDGNIWTDYGATDDQKRKLVGGDSNSSLFIPNGTNYFRIRFRATSYVYLNALYSYWSSNGHSTKVQIYKQHDSDSYTQHTSSETNVSAWPGHLYLPFAVIPFNPSAILGSHYHEVSIVFIPTWNASYPSNNITLSKIQLWGGYPAGKRNVYATDEYQNVVFPSNITSTKNLSVGGTFISVGSTNLVTNLNANYLNGVPSTGFVGIGQTGNFITTLTGGTDISITGSGVGRTINDTSTLATVTGRGASTSTILNLLGGAYFGSTNQSILKNDGSVGIGTTNPNKSLDIFNALGSSFGVGSSSGDVSTQIEWQSLPTAIDAQFGRSNNNLWANLLYADSTTFGAAKQWAVGLRAGDSDYHIYSDGAGFHGLTIKQTTGYVGIGTGAPNYKLDVVGDGYFSTNFSIGGTFLSVGSTNLVTNL
ncbi:MAG: hypothetical protein WC895_03485, partial [Candidatus Shapirobacteria bacterium]